MESGPRWEPIARVYCPLQAGSIDGTDSRPHDRAIERAIKVIHYTYTTYTCTVWTQYVLIVSTHPWTPITLYMYMYVHVP